ncbi:hypothetical protein BH09BAC3_BH09BAC3_27750 [soil metagenome]
MFTGRSLVIATKHQKEKVIAPLIEKYLGVKCTVPENFDTDIFGTFAGEVERDDDPITTARKKCLRAMEFTGVDLAIASEGSFGAHPHLHFVPADDEIILLMDRKNQIEIIARELTAETNFNGETIFDHQQMVNFADRVSFPSHGLIIRKSKETQDNIVKGVTDWNHLDATVKFYLEKFGSAYLETDMRAQYNPMRMKCIESATFSLINKAHSYCPRCGTPGFDVVESFPGLPCKICHSPTRSLMKQLLCCQVCTFKMEKMFPHDKEYEEPNFCDHCNP